MLLSSLACYLSSDTKGAVFFVAKSVRWSGSLVGPNFFDTENLLPEPFRSLYTKDSTYNKRKVTARTGCHPGGIDI